MAPANAINQTTTGITGFSGTAFVGTPVTNHGIVLGGSTSSTLGNVGPSATAGQVLQSAGSSADPVFSTATYPATAGTSGNVLTSNGTNFVSSALPAAVYDPPIGSLQYFVNSAGDAYLGSNWLKCNGASVSQATYATLFTRLGLVSDVQNATFTSTANLPATTNSIAFGASVYVAVGNSGAISSSTDLITWNTRTSGTASNLNSVIFGNGLFLAAGVTSALINSTDGITWSALTYGATTTIVCLGYGNGKYLASSTAGVMRTSTDTITWAAATSNAPSAINSINYGNGKYVWTTASTTTGIGYSTDAVTWTAVATKIAAPGINNATFINGLFTTLNAQSNVDGTEILTSSDGITWRTYPFQFAYGASTANKGMFNTGSKIYAILQGQAAASGPRYIATSTDGINYIPFATSQLQAITPNNVVASSTTLFVPGATNYYASLFTYNTATNFVLPTENSSGTLSNQAIPYNLYIKAL